MIVDFAKFDMKERPTLILKNANCVPLGVLGYAYNISIDLCYNETSSIEFDLPAWADGSEVPYYDDVIGLQIVELKGIGQFTLVNPNETGDGVTKVKTCKGYSLEYEFAYKKLTLPEDTYNFYSLTDNTNTLMGIILEKMPSWSIGSVDDSLIDKYRTYEVSNENLYNFIKGTVQESYNCIFDFDSSTRQIYVRDISRDAEEVPVYISTDNLATEIQVEENTEDIVTRLDVNGADGVNIRDVNPCGTNKIIDLSHFMTTKNFDQELVDKYNKWSETVSNNQQTYYSLSIEYSAQVMRRTTQEAKLTDLKGELADLENVQAVTIQAIAQGLQDQSALDVVNANISAKQAEISAKKAEIEAIEAEVTGAMEELKVIQTACSFEKYFTEDEQQQMDKYIKDDEISESSFALVEQDTYSAENIGTTLSGAISINEASITSVSSASRKNIYDISGGSVRLGDLINGSVVSGIIEIATDYSFVATIYIASGTYSGNTFNNACVSIIGDASDVTDDMREDKVGLKSGTSISFRTSGAYQYFTFNVSEYQKRSVAWELFQYGKEILNKLAYPSYTFSVSSGNFFTSEDFDLFRKEICLGKKIYIKLGNNEVLKPICIEIKLNYENPGSLELEFSDSYTSNDSTFHLVDLLEQSVSMGKNLDVSKYIYSSFVDSGASDSIKDFMTSSLDVAKNSIMASSSQAISWDGAGLRLRKYADDSHTTYDDEQIWMINNNIVMTADNWATAQMAIGKFHDENLGECWGIVAPRIVGTMLAGKELLIESTKKEGGVSAFRVDGDGVRINNGDLSITKGTMHIVINPDVGIVIGEYPVVVKDEETGAYSVNTDKAKFWADEDGNLVFAGTLHGANGDFTGAITATSLEISKADVTKDIDEYIADGVLNEVEPLDERLTETELKVTDSAIVSTITGSKEYQNLLNDVSNADSAIETLQTQMSMTSDGLSVIQNKTVPDLDGRVRNIESGVHIEGSEIGIYSSDSPFQNTITNTGWKITENDSAIITCAENKLTVPRVQVTDVLMLGGLAVRSGTDKHVRILRYRK